MSSGYVTTNIPLRPDRVKSPKGSGVSVNLPAGPFGDRSKFSVNDYAWSNPITSFRSGPSYEREVRKPGAVVGEQNLNELLAAEAGDFGHEFSMRKVTDFYGYTRSVRPTVAHSPLWSQLTQPIGMCFSTSNSGNSALPSLFVDSGYGFVKSASDLVTLGTSFIKSTNPIQSQVNLLSSIAEAITDGALLPALLGKSIVSSVINPNRRRDIIKATGGEYLNYIFGYKPLADDIAKTGVLIDTVNGLIDQWIKDSGTIVRRRRRIPGVPKTAWVRGLDVSGGAMTGFTLNAFMPASTYPEAKLKNPYWSTAVFESDSLRSQMSTQGFMVSRVSSEISFSAGYTYDVSRMFLPVAGGSATELMHNAAVRDGLESIAFGLDSSSIATAVYDATPFSWLLDWFVNIGDVIDNFRGLTSRGVQMLWGYMTETAIRDCYFEYTIKNNPTGQVFFRSSGFSAQKAITRVRATPFGFGTSFGSLSNSQSATLAALAAAKSR